MINIFDKFLEKIEDFFTAFSALAIFILMITATVQIISRKVLNMPIPGYIDFAEQSIAIFAFIAIAIYPNVFENGVLNPGKKFNKKIWTISLLCFALLFN